MLKQETLPSIWAIHEIKGVKEKNVVFVGFPASRQMTLRLNMDNVNIILLLQVFEVINYDDGLRIKTTAKQCEINILNCCILLLLVEFSPL